MDNIEVMRKDAQNIEEFAQWLMAEYYAKTQHGQDGKIESEKVKEYARIAIKICAEYL